MQVLELKNVVDERLNVPDGFCRSVEGWGGERMSEFEDVTKGGFTLIEKR